MNIEYRREKWYNGNICFEIPYLDGKKHGIEKWFRLDGTPEIELTFQNGIKHGQARTWHPNGVLENFVMFKDGSKIGLDVKYDEFGNHLTTNKY